MKVRKEAPRQVKPGKTLFLNGQEVPRIIEVRVRPLTPLEELELAMLGPKPQTSGDQPLTDKEGFLDGVKAW